MVGGRSTGAVAIAVALAFAGCFAQAPDDGEDPPAKGLPPSQVKADTAAEKPGRLDGLVTDEVSTPIPGVTLTLRGGGDIDLQASSDEAGKFLFEGLPNGTYSLVAEKTGFEPAQHPFSLAPGETKAVELELVAVAVEAPPEVEELSLDGFLKCGVNYLGFGDVAFLDRPCVFDEQNEPTVEFEVRAGAKTVLTEITWDRAQASTTASLLVRLESEAAGGAWELQNDTTGSSPRRMRADEGQVPDTDENPDRSYYPETQGQEAITWRVDVWPPGGVQPGIVLDQPFHVRVLVWYNQTAPQDDTIWAAPAS